MTGIRNKLNPNFAIAFLSRLFSPFRKMLCKICLRPPMAGLTPLGTTCCAVAALRADFAIAKSGLKRIGLIIILAAYIIPLSPLSAHSQETTSTLSYITSFPEGGCKQGNICDQPGEFHCPEGLDIYYDKFSNEYLLIVADVDNHRIQLIDPKTGRMVYQLGNSVDNNCSSEQNASWDKLCAPKDAVPTKEGSIVVADTFHKRYVKFEKNNTYFQATSAWDYDQSDDTCVGCSNICIEFESKPVGLVIDTEDHLYSTDVNGGCPRFRKMNHQTTQEIASIGFDASGSPYGLAIDNKDILLLTRADAYTEPRIEKYSKELKLINQLSLNIPKQDIRGIAVDKYNNIIVAGSKGQLNIYNSNGQLLMEQTVTRLNGDPALLYGVTVTGSGEIFVAACGAVKNTNTRGEILKYQISCIDQDKDGYGMYCSEQEDCLDTNPYLHYHAGPDNNKSCDGTSACCSKEQQFSRNGQCVDQCDQQPTFGWPMFRGNLERTGWNSKEKDLKPPLQMCWSALRGDPQKADANMNIEASPIIADGKVYIATLYDSFPNGVEQSHNSSIIAFDLFSGEILWSTKLGDKGIWATPAIEMGRVYAVTFEGKVVSLNAGADTASYNGSIFWSKQITQTPRALRASPVVVNNRLYVGTFESANNKLYVFDAIKGEILATQPLSGGLYSSPLVIDQNKLVLVLSIGDGDSMIEMYDIASAQIKGPIWSRKIKGDSWSTPLYSNGKIFHLSGKWRGQPRDGRIYVLDVQTGKDIITPYPLSGSFRSSPAIDEKRLYVTTGTKELTAFNIEKLMAQDPNPVEWAFISSDGGDIAASPTIANGYVYLSTDDNGNPEGVFYVLDAQNGKIVWIYEANKGVGSAQASPAVSNGMVIFLSYDDDQRIDHGVFAFCPLSAEAKKKSSKILSNDNKKNPQSLIKEFINKKAESNINVKKPIKKK